jgi:hypothetical protein
MTGSHEVRGSIPLGSTNKFNHLKPSPRINRLLHTHFAPLAHRKRMLAFEVLTYISLAATSPGNRIEWAHLSGQPAAKPERKDAEWSAKDG